MWCERATITVVKLDTRGRVKLCYPAAVVERRPHSIVVRSAWTLPPRDLGCARFEPGDRFTEYYYTNRWFDVQEVVGADGRRKGWYCDIAEPTVVAGERVSLVDLELDVWVSAAGAPLILDEEEFARSPLSDAQRTGARQGLQALLAMLAARRDGFATLR
jgi:uncharacterized protein